jgi:hypothetical protein
MIGTARPTTEIRRFGSVGCRASPVRFGRLSGSVGSVRPVAGLRRSGSANSQESRLGFG